MALIIKNLLDKAERTHELRRDEIVSLLSLPDEALFRCADRVRAKYVGDEVHLRGLIEFSNYCRQNCLYCGIRRENENVQRYRLSFEQILDFACKAVSYGYRTLVLQSGEDPYFDVDILSSIIKEIKKHDVAITLSTGEYSRDDYETLRKAGVDRFLLRIETTCRELYQTMSPEMSWENRVRCLRDLKRLGFETGSGCLIGLPNQTIESIADDILFFKEIEADMIGIGPFIPHPDTPLHTCSVGDFWLALRAMAITRIILPDINIPATTAMETLHPDGRLIALQSGANVVMPNVTEGEYREYYALYPGKICINESPMQCRGCITQKIESIGRKVSSGYGFRKQRSVI